jgi:hypothetical protein
LALISHLSFYLLATYWHFTAKSAISKCNKS